jgi:hypothetical protein
MDWIKRNLYFLIGGLVALALTGLAGFYAYSKWSENNQVKEDLNKDVEEMRALASQNPHPGSGKIDNITIARDQQKEVKALIDKVRGRFQRMEPVPEGEKVTEAEFSSALSLTVAQLLRDATNNSVTVPPNFNFSFTAEKGQLQFNPNSLRPLSAQLGEVKAIANILLGAKINAIDYFRRERVCAEDNAGPQTEYLEKKSITNELAVVTPYEVTFRCFSAELASVLAGFSSSPFGVVVKTINVEQGAAQSASPDAGQSPTPTYTYIQTPTQAAENRSGMDSQARAAFERRYGRGRGGGAPTPQPQAQPTQPQVVIAAPGAPGQPGVPGRTGPSIVLDERQLKVTLTLNVVKLLASK